MKVVLALLLLAAATLLFESCSPRNGCYATQGMSGYHKR